MDQNFNQQKPVKPMESDIEKVQLLGRYLGEISSLLEQIEFNGQKNTHSVYHSFLYVNESLKIIEELFKNMQMGISKEQD